jgi:lysylphosphatidylglycerol synthetase-like protein (DUF2156 family)
MFEGPQYWWTHLINGFVALWVYGHGWYAPVYYGVLFALALSIRERMKWQENAFLVLFVVGISLAHGGVIALIALAMINLMGGWLFGIPVMLVALYGLSKVVGSLRHTVNGRMQLAKSSLIKGAASLLLVLGFIGVWGYHLADWH